MKVQILTPEKIILDTEVDSVTVPGMDGNFQLLKDHTAIISSLNEGTVKIYTNQTLESASLQKFEKGYEMDISGGVIEFNNNTAIILCD